MRSTPLPLIAPAYPVVLRTLSSRSAQGFTQRARDFAAPAGLFLGLGGGHGAISLFISSLCKHVGRAPYTQRLMYGSTVKAHQ